MARYCPRFCIGCALDRLAKWLSPFTVTWRVTTTTYLAPLSETQQRHLKAAFEHLDKSFDELNKVFDEVRR